MALRLLRFVVFPLWTVPAVLRAQTGAEYGLHSSGGSLAGDRGYAIAGCKVDSTLLSCLSRSYPRAMILVAVVIGLLILRWLGGRRGYRAH